MSITKPFFSESSLRLCSMYVGCFHLHSSTYFVFDTFSKSKVIQMSITKPIWLSATKDLLKCIDILQK